MYQNDLKVNGCGASRAELDRIEEALSFIDPNLPRDEWWKILAGLKSELGEAGQDLALQWSRGGDSFDMAGFDDTWKSLMPGGGISIATVFFMAKEGGWNDTTPRLKLTAEQIKARHKAQGQAAKEAEAKALADQARAAEQAATIWEKARPADSHHPYLKRKQVAPTATLRQITAEELARILGYQPKCKDGVLADVVLVVPARKVGSDALSTLELIDEEGRKAALRGQGTKSHACWTTTYPLPPDPKELLIGEGPATCMSAAEATGLPAVASLTCSNLRAVAEDLSTIYPKAKITILADLDKKKGLPIPQAVEAAKAVNGFLAAPGFGPGREEGQTDFNDLSVLAGPEAVRTCIAAARQVPEPAQDAKKAPAPEAPVWPEFIPFEKLPPELPVGLLPGILGEFAEGLAEATQTPRELAAVNALGVAALCVQDKAIVRVKPDYSEGLNLYGIVASEPGERKSAVVSACKAPVVAWEQEQEQQAHAAILEAASMRKTMERAIDKARAKAAGAKTAGDRQAAAREIWEMERELPEVPGTPRMLVNDVTPEALAAVMAASGESIGMLEAEGGALDTFAGRYSNSMPNIDLLLMAFGAEPFVVDRKGKDPLRLRSPRLTLVLTPQPSVLRAAGSNPAFVGRGLIARCILVLPQSRVGFRDNSRTIDPSLSRQWESFVRYLLSIPKAVGAQHEMRLSNEAYSVWADFSQHVEGNLREGGAFEFMTAWGSKLTGLVVRLAGIFHLADGGKEDGEIRKYSMEQACKFGLWAAEHARNAFSAFGVDEGQDGAKRILDWLRKERRESVTAREIFVAMRGRYPRMEQIRPSLEMLIEHGAIVPGAKAATSPKGGRPAETYLVNPAICL